MGRYDAQIGELDRELSRLQQRRDGAQRDSEDYRYWQRYCSELSGKLRVWDEAEGRLEELIAQIAEQRLEIRRNQRWACQIRDTWRACRSWVSAVGLFAVAWGLVLGGVWPWLVVVLAVGALVGSVLVPERAQMAADDANAAPKAKESSLVREYIEWHPLGDRPPDNP